MKKKNCASGPAEASAGQLHGNSGEYMSGVTEDRQMNKAVEDVMNEKVSEGVAVL